MALSSESGRDITGVLLKGRRSRTMKRSQFNEEQIIEILREADAGSPVKAMGAPHSISTATYHAWKRKFGGMEVSEAKRLRGLEEENSRLKRAESAEAATKRLSEFDAGPWGQKYPMIAESWRRNWEQIISHLQLSARGAKNHLHHQCD